MANRRVWIAGIALLALLSAFLGGALGTALLLDRRRVADEGPAPELLEPGGPRAGALDLPRVKERTFALEVPPHAVAVRVKLVSRGAELSLSARKDLQEGGREDAGFDFAVATD